MSFLQFARFDSLVARHAPTRGYSPRFFDHHRNTGRRQQGRKQAEPVGGRVGAAVPGSFGQVGQAVASADVALAVGVVASAVGESAVGTIGNDRTAGLTPRHDDHAGGADLREPTPAELAEAREAWQAQIVNISGNIFITDSNGRPPFHQKTGRGELP